jgi:dUTP pyrophosphatase
LKINFRTTQFSQKYNPNMDEQVKQKLAELRKNTYEIQCEVLDGGQMPTKAHATDAGFDLYATEDIELFPGQVKKTPLNIRLKLPHGTWAEITTKSGLGSQGQLVYAGVIDQEYRGVPHVIMSNINIISHIDPEGFPIMRTNPIVIKKGQKVAQLIMNPYSDLFYMAQVESVDTNTNRGEGGFGSTGA